MKRSIFTFCAAICALLVPAQGIKLDEQSRARLLPQGGPMLELEVQNTPDLVPTARLYTGRFEGDFSLKNYGIHQISKNKIRIPISQLSPSFQKVLIQTLWPKDKISGDTYHHYIGYSQETLWSIAEWFTGKGQHYRSLQKASGMRSDRINKGQRISIPLELLIPALKIQDLAEDLKPNDPIIADATPVIEADKEITADSVPLASEPNSNALTRSNEEEESLNEEEDESDEDDPPPHEETEGVPTQTYGQLGEIEDGRSLLTYKSDREGKYAEYRLKKGEAIYSAVVVRFCGLIRADHVNDLARIIIRRSNIPDETDIAIGTPIKIPYEYLEPEYREVNDPEYIAAIENLRAVAQLSTKVESRNLYGVYIILDAGHGGRDPGAKFGNVWEDDYVYDIICRIKYKLEAETSATVLTTVLDPSVQYKVQNVRSFRHDQDEILLTKPHFKLDSSRVDRDGVNLRWMMANSKAKELIAKGVKPENLIFTSFHADSLHPSLRGSMIYIPDAVHYPKNTIKGGQSLSRYYEATHAHYTFQKQEVLDAQARSQAFASAFIDAARKNSIRVHRRKPIRTVINRSPRFSFVPAVIKYNRIPTRLLLEVCNLNNRSDRTLLRKPEFRQKVAESYVQALYSTYGVLSGRSAAGQTVSGAARPTR